MFTLLQVPHSCAGTLRNIGDLFAGMGAYVPAKNALIQSVQIAERIEDKQLAAGNYYALGRLSEAQKDFISAKAWYAKALSLFESLRDGQGAAIVRRNLEYVTAMKHLTDSGFTIQWSK